MFFIFSSIVSAESIKDYVCIVNPVIPDNEKEYTSTLQDQLNSKGYVRYADSIDCWKKGVFGSGFVYLGQDSQPYVLTNLHVMSHYPSANVTFEDSESGQLKEYKNLKVVAVSDEIDICVLAFTENSEDFK